MRTPLNTLRACRLYLPQDFREAHARLFAEEHLTRLAERLASFQREGPLPPLPPHLSVECTPPLAEAWEPFRVPMHVWEHAQDEEAPGLLQAFADAIVSGGTPSLLLLLGQRLTPASVTDVQAIPPTRAELLAAADVPHGSPDALTVAARALAKHASRSTGGFWGAATGPSATRNARARELLERILDQATWWNIFSHYKHELAYEARVRSGHGARWRWPRLQFIGFVEPFLVDENRSRS